MSDEKNLRGIASGKPKMPPEKWVDCTQATVEFIFKLPEGSGQKRIASKSDNTSEVYKGVVSMCDQRPYKFRIITLNDDGVEIGWKVLPDFITYSIIIDEGDLRGSDW